MNKEKLDELQNQCWSAMQSLQIDLSDQWESSIWNNIIDYLMINNWPEDMVGFIPALLGTKVDGAIGIIEDNLSHIPMGIWTQTILDNLLSLAEDSISTNGKTRKYARDVYTNLEKRHLVS